MAIARTLGTTAVELKATNGLTSDIIHPGQILYTRGGTGLAPTTPAPSVAGTGSTPVTSTNTTGKASYTVKAGDGLYAAARALGITVAEVKAANGLSSDMIYPGQVLYGTKAAVVKTPAKPASTPAASTNTTGKASYTVKAGDGLYVAARALGMTVAEVKAANGLSSDVIYPGQVLYAAGKTVKSQPTVNQTATPTAQPKAVVEAAASNGKTHTVKSGETMWRIATSNGLTVDRLMQLNGLTNHNLYVGQTLKLVGNAAPVAVAAAKPAASTAPAAKPAAPAQSSAKAYTIQKGDTLYRIAKNNGVSLDKLMAANGLSTADIMIGQTITIPAG